MATTAEASPPLEIPAGRIVVPGVEWDDYEKMLEVVGNRHIYVTPGSRRRQQPDGGRKEGIW